MRRIISIIVLLFISLLSFPQTSHAQTCPFTVTQEPEKLFWFDDKDREITLTFRYEQPNYFLEKTGYTFVIWFKKNQEGNFARGAREISTNSGSSTGGYGKIDIIENGQALKIYDLKKLGWDAESGYWPYRIYAGTGRDYYKKTPLICAGRVEMPPCHRDTDCPTTFTAFQNQFRGTTPIQFEIVDPNPDREYVIWFEGEDKKKFKPAENLALLQQQPIMETEPPFVSQENPHSVYVGPIDAPKPRDKPYVLCFSEGDECDFAISGISIVAYPIETTTDPAISIRYGEEESSISPEEPSPTRPPLPCKETATSGACVEIDTAVGPIRLDPFEFVKSIMAILLGFAGGIAVILIIVAGYRLMASQGNPEAVQAAREQITSAIVGLAFVIFSLVLLEVIGVDILRIPGFGE